MVCGLQSNSKELVVLEISSAAKVGMIGLLAIIILGLIFSQIGSWKNRETGYEINILFDQVSGLQEQTKVTLSGVTVGKVKKITILPNHKVKITALITYKGLAIKKDSKFTIIGSLWGDKWVEIYPKPNEEVIVCMPTPVAALTPGEEVVGINPVSIEQIIYEGQAALRQLKDAIAQINNLVGDPKTQKEFKGTIANFYAISQNIKDNVGKITSDVSTFSGSLKRMALGNEENIKVMATNLKTMSHNLNVAMETIKTIVTKKEFSDDIAQTLANIRKASEEIAGIAGDIRIITSDPQIKEDLKGTINEARQTVHQANVMFSGINGMLGTDKQENKPSGKNKMLRIDVESEWVKSTGVAVPNMNLILFPQGKFNLKMGADSIGHGTVLNLQGGTNYKNIFYPRFGVIRSNLGLGLDSKIGNLFNISIDAYDTQKTKVDAIGRLNIGKDFYILGGQRNMFDNQLKTTIFGVGKSF